MEEDLNILANGRHPQKKIMQPKTIKFKTTALGNVVNKISPMFRCPLERLENCGT